VVGRDLSDSPARVDYEAYPAAMGNEVAEAVPQLAL
jgi:hypothetical protein